MAVDDMTGSSGIGLFGYIILFVIIVWVFGGAIGGGFNRGGNFGGGAQTVENWQLMFDTFKQSCENEKANIQNIATTQYLVEQQANATQALVNAQANAINTKIDYYAYQNLRDQLQDSKAENIELKNRIYSNTQFNELSQQIANIRYNMLTRPDVTGVGVACPSQAILNGLGVTSLNNNGCGCNAVI